ncbi:MAG TPA: bifunctional glutamate N-acetyltransferase/amino-acid acetyltransferase ArgJ [Pirellulales bacterium]
MSFALPYGYRAAGVACGIKASKKLDLALIVSDAPAAAAGVYTLNLVCAAPVVLDRKRTPSDAIRAVVINSGNANACTGERGDKDAEQMAALAAQTCGARPEQVLVLSTGIIGEFMPMDKVAAGVRGAAEKLAHDEASLVAAATGMLTTDTTHKLASRQIKVGDHTYRLTGMAKGAAMIGPRMATMLGVIMTDAPLKPADAQSLLSAAVEDSFNCISVDGHMSTNDTVLLLANGAAGGEPLTGAGLAEFAKALEEVAVDLAKAIPIDGEGATHLITVEVDGCATREAARQIAKTVAESMLVKTAVAGADPNWGRIVSAAGYAGVPFRPTGVSLRLNGVQLYTAGQPTHFDRVAVSRSIREHRETLMQLSFSEGAAKIRFWSTDLTAEYVRLNADYTT